MRSFAEIVVVSDNPMTRFMVHPSDRLLVLLNPAYGVLLIVANISSNLKPKNPCYHSNYHHHPIYVYDIETRKDTIEPPPV
eukprot:XP_001706541.1 Hypothetical protein GL50803_94127 [Giardia lamblia ATCC 50803]